MAFSRTVEDWSDVNDPINDPIDPMDDPIAIMNEMSRKETEREEAVKNQDKMMINHLRIKPKTVVDVVSFDSIERVYHFWIDGQQHYESSKPLPKLVLPENMREMDLDLEIDFEDCFENKGLIEDYYQYREKKWNYFLKSIKDKQLVDRYRPQFVSFGGPIADILATIYDTSIEWKMSAEMDNDVIYFFKTRNERVRGEYQNKQSLRRSYCGLKFLHLITDRDDNQLNEFEKCFAINCIDFVGNKILSLNELDAIDNDDKAVDIKMTQVIASARDSDFFTKKKLLRFWSKACVQGVDRLVIGNTKSNNYLLDIEERKVEGIPEDCSHKWSDKNCLEFLQRFFTFMKSCITEENVVYEFHFKAGEEYVICNRIHPKRRKTIFPEFYKKIPLIES